ncbi:MAG TPA: hypothetical protein VFR36_01975 [Sphingomicrobium sp.]|nr:hypothetical protein [Sphingomicrobium sp.]
MTDATPEPPPTAESRADIPPVNGRVVYGAGQFPVIQRLAPLLFIRP